MTCARAFEWRAAMTLGRDGAAIAAACRIRSAISTTGRHRFLQYTSGSTSDPKGVAVTHANLLSNLEMIRVSLGNTKQSTYVNWVPLYHDMGLILNALEALYVGALCVLLAPNAFMQRPLNWIRAIHTYRAEVACGPNFGYDLCINRYRADQMDGVDLPGKLLPTARLYAGNYQKFAETFGKYGFDRSAIFPPMVWLK